MPSSLDSGSSGGLDNFSPYSLQLDHLLFDIYMVISFKRTYIFCHNNELHITFRFLKESSRWLITKGKIDEAIKILEEIGKVDPRLMKSYKTTAEEDYKNNSSINVSILDLFKTPNLRSNVISMILNWGLTSFLFEANFRNVANLPYSIYWTFAIYSLLEFPSDIASIWGLDVIGRRFSAVITLGSFSVMMIICIPLIDDTLLVTIFGTIGRFFIICSMNTALQLRLLEALALRQYLVHSKQAIS